ncbi:MAG: hypothetical protein FWF00_05010 [Endomicrobia bacterium]|nr:hypothetical protein [Endomicrobiia bacterium]MCL2507027.1 hypothetical protein [Endomicrobiia bacterium]
MMGLFYTLFRLIGLGAMAYGFYVIVRWYIFWLFYNFMGQMDYAIIAGLVTFFFAPIAGLFDLFWHSFMKTTVDMWIEFLMFFVGGRVVFGIGNWFKSKPSNM